jgi:hypothetical protein
LGGLVKLIINLYEIRQKVFLPSKKISSNEAIIALENALKSAFDKWKLWHNLVIMSIESQRWQKAIEALNRLFDIKGKEAFNLMVNTINTICFVADSTNTIIVVSYCYYKRSNETCSSLGG